jgi:phosphopantothenoylcysteine decarboxylase/phosphopantothenate--cysteine ligase
MFKKVLITSGATIEPIDPVRFISNRSSGKTGYHLAVTAKDLGAEEVYFITGKTSYHPPDVKIIEVETALDMREKVFEFKDKCDVIIMAAAVSDFRCLKYYSEKIKKNNDTITLRFKKNPDILYELGMSKREEQILVGFAAETENSLENANKKLLHKNLDLLILNEISDNNPAFDSEYNEIFILRKNETKKIERSKKALLAKIIWQEILKFQ